MRKTELQIANARLNEDEIVAGKVRMESLPGHIFTELTRSCNLRCFMCARTAAGLPRKCPDMEWSLFEKVERELFPTAVLVELNGLGESPLMDRWADVMERVAKYSLHPLIVSNGQELDIETIDFFILREGIIRLSVDGASPDLYEKLRSGASFEKLCASLALIRRRARTPYGTGFNLDFATVLSSENIAEWEEIVRLAARYDADTLIMQHLVPFTRAMAGKSLVNSPVKSNDALWKVRVLARQLGVRVALPDFFEAPGADDLRSFFADESRMESRANEIIREHRSGIPGHCMAPWNTTYIEFDGSVKPCCVSETVLGNLSETDFKTIWNGDAYSVLRAQNLGKVPLADPSCKNCYVVQSNRKAALMQVAERE